MKIYCISINIIFLSFFSANIVALEDFRYYLSTKTPYRFVQNDNIDVKPYPGCEYRKSWFMLRHGSRYPSDELINFMQGTLPDLRTDLVNFNRENKGPLNEYQLSIFEKWSPLNVSLKDEKKLSDEGRKEMEELSSRMQKRFNSIFPKRYDNKTFIFKHTPTQRTRESAKHFAIGLFGKKAAENVNYIATSKNDPVLRFYKGCDYWQKYVKKNPKTYEQLKLYNDTEEMAWALETISEILGFDEPVFYNIAKFLYQTCAFEQSFWGEDYVSPWCFLFTDETIQVMEYAEDLKYYWVDGYGFAITRSLACTVLDDVIRFFVGNNTHLSAFNFSHSGTILKILAYLGLYNDSHTLTYVRDSNRAWRTSYIDAFGSNIGFILYRCGNVDKVLVMHQERPVRLPECEEDLCPLKVIIDSRRESLVRCDLKRMCNITKDEL